MKIILILMSMSLYVTSMANIEQFCDKNRPLLLGGVFNFDKYVFAYSWRQMSEVTQKQTVWRFKIKTDGTLTEFGSVLEVNQIFPGIPLFKAGFGLKFICEKTDQNCELHNNLVFVFFQTLYKVFRFNVDRFDDEPKTTALPWGLQNRAEAKNFGFGNKDIDSVMAAAFVTGTPSLIFIVSKNILYSSSVDLTASALKWTKLAESPIFLNVLGAFTSGSDILFNVKQPPDSLLEIYDQNGKQSKTTTVWEFFGCKPIDEPDSEKSVHKNDTENTKTEAEELTDRYALIIIISIVVAVVISNCSAAIFWYCVLKRQKSEELKL